MSKTKPLTVGELTKATKIPASTIRYYINNYSEYLHGSLVEGTKTVVYDPESMDVLKAIRKAQNEGKKKHEILKSLRGKFTQTYDGEKKSQGDNKQHNNKQLATHTSQHPQLIQTIKQLSEFLENQVQLTGHYQEQNRQQKQTLGDLLEENKELRAKISELRVTGGNPKRSLLSRLIGN